MSAEITEILAIFAEQFLLCSVLAQLQDWQLAAQEADVSREKAIAAAEAAKQFEEAVLEEQSKRDTLDVMATITSLRPIALQDNERGQISDEEVQCV